QAAGTGIVAASSLFLTRAGIGTRLRGIMVSLLAVLLIAGLFSTVFGEAYKAYEQRNLTANTFSNSTTERIIHMFLPNSMFEASIGGIGIGLGTTGTGAALKGRQWYQREGDLDRNFLELGLFCGWIFVALRWAMALWLVLISLRAARNGDST